MGKLLTAASLFLTSIVKVEAAEGSSQHLCLGTTTGEALFSIGSVLTLPLTYFLKGKSVRIIICRTHLQVRSEPFFPRHTFGDTVFQSITAVVCLVSGVFFLGLVLKGVALGIRDFRRRFSQATTELSRPHKELEAAKKTQEIRDKELFRLRYAINVAT